MERKKGIMMSYRAPDRGYIWLDPSVNMLKNFEDGSWKIIATNTTYAKVERLIIELQKMNIKLDVLATEVSDHDTKITDIEQNISSILIRDAFANGDVLTITKADGSQISFDAKKSLMDKVTGVQYTGSEARFVDKENGGVLSISHAVPTDDNYMGGSAGLMTAVDKYELDSAVKNVGYLGQLLTHAKDDLVAAINEVNSKGGSNAIDVTDLLDGQPMSITMTELAESKLYAQGAVGEIEVHYAQNPRGHYLYWDSAPINLFRDDVDHSTINRGYVGIESNGGGVIRIVEGSGRNVRVGLDDNDIEDLKVIQNVDELMYKGGTQSISMDKLNNSVLVSTEKGKLDFVCDQDLSRGYIISHSIVSTPEYPMEVVIFTNDEDAPEVLLNDHAFVSADAINAIEVMFDGIIPTKARYIISEMGMTDERLFYDKGVITSGEMQIHGKASAQLYAPMTLYHGKSYSIVIEYETPNENFYKKYQVSGSVYVDPIPEIPLGDVYTFVKKLLTKETYHGVVAAEDYVYGIGEVEIPSLNVLEAPEDDGHYVRHQKQWVDVIGDVDAMDGMLGSNKVANAVVNFAEALMSESTGIIPEVLRTLTIHEHNFEHVYSRTIDNLKEGTHIKIKDDTISATDILDSATIENFILESGNYTAEKAPEYCIKIKREDFFKPVILKFRVIATIYDEALDNTGKYYKSRHEVEIGFADTIKYSIVNNALYNTSYIPVKSISLFNAKNEVEFNENPYTYIGVALRGATNQTKPAFARNITVELISTEGCSEVELMKDGNNNLAMISLSDLGYTTVPSTYTRADISLNTQGLVHTGDVNTTYDLAENNNGGVYVIGNETFYRYVIVGKNKEDKIIPLNVSNNNTSATKIPSTQGFDATKNLMYYNTTSTATSGTTTVNVFSNTNKFSLVNSIQWTENILNYPNIYIKFLKGEDGLLYLPQPTEDDPYPVYHSTELPTEDDGYYYWYIGRMYTKVNGFYLDDKQLIYKYNTYTEKVEVVDRFTLDFILTYSEVNSILEDLTRRIVELENR